MGKIRDAERTRGRILAAATREFAAKGFDGARVDVIAARARTNKQMLYHYFGDKRGLFTAVVKAHLEGKARTHEAAPPDVADMLPYYFEAAESDREWLRFLLWEALSYGEREVLGEEVRCEAMQRGVERMRRAQLNGAMPRGIGAEHAVLAMMSLATFPWAFPQITRLLTGVGPSDAGFRRAYAVVLREIAERLRDPPASAPAAAAAATATPAAAPAPRARSSSKRAGGVKSGR